MPPARLLAMTKEGLAEQALTKQIYSTNNLRVSTVPLLRNS